MKTVTIEQLKRLGACKETLDFLRDRFGETVAITEENAVACAAEIDWKWAARNLLPVRLRQQYLEAVAPLRKQYDEAVVPLWQQYEEARAPLWKQYEEAVAPLWQQYKEACARLFVSLYNQTEE